MTLPTDKTWKFYGSKAPYFGVFGQEEYLEDNLDERKIAEFFASGETYVAELFDMIRTKIDPGFRPASILDFGCGPGRMLVPFSRNAQWVTGMDISQEMLDTARINCDNRNVSNVSFLLADDEISRVGDKKFDLVHSFIVLQHLDTRRGEKLLTRLVEKISPDGIGVIHFTYFDHYKGRKLLNYFRSNIPFFAHLIRIFRNDPVKKQLKRRPQMQMNAYDLNRIFRLLQSNGINETLVKFTNHHDYWGVILCFKK